MMFTKKIISFVLVAMVINTSVYAQADVFCTVLHTLIADAANKFIMTKGATIDANEDAIKWECNTAVPGVRSARVVSFMGLFYEGALYQTKSADSLQQVYNKYKQELSICLVGDQYKLTAADNFNKGLEQYKKLIFIRPATDTTLAGMPPHVSMEVDYSKPDSTYTVLLFVWEH
jgi:hypothetical protein